MISAYADYGLLVRPGALPAARLVASYFPADAITGFACLAFILLLTPTGSLPSPRWRPWTALIAATAAGLLLAVALTPAQAGYRHPRDPFDLHNAGGAQLLAYQLAFPVILLAVVAGALSLLFRLHRAAGTERLQLRWVSLAAGLVALVLVVFLASAAAGVPSLPDPGLVGTVCLVILTLGISAATLAYRLYDLDRIISRTLAYGLLTVLLGDGSRTWSTGISTGVATMPPRPSVRSPPGYGSSPISTAWPMNCCSNLTTLSGACSATVPFPRRSRARR